MTDEERSELVASVAIVLAYAVAIGAQAFVIANEASHGQLGRDLAAWWARQRARWAARHDLERQVAEDAPWVVWEAIQIAEEGATSE